MRATLVRRTHVDFGEGIEGPQREEEQGRQLPGDHGESGGQTIGWMRDSDG
jgi:hypothetical protein